MPATQERYTPDNDAPPSFRLDVQLHELLTKACPEFGRNAQITAWFERVRSAA